MEALRNFCIRSTKLKTIIYTIIPMPTKFYYYELLHNFNS